MAQSLARSISVWQGIALYIGAVIGSGILILPGMTANIAGADSLLAWGGMVVLSIPLASTFARLARDYPSAGGVATFVERAFGHYAGALVGWFYFAGATAGQFIVPLTGGIYVAYVFDAPRTAAFGIAASILFGAIIANYFGLRTSGKVQLATSSLIVAILMATILVAMPSINWRASMPGVTGIRWNAVGRSAMLIFWSFFGWEAIASLAPEFRHPQRDVQRATWGSLAIVGVLYLGISAAIVGTHAYVRGTAFQGEEMNNASLAHVMGLAIGRTGEVVTALLALAICLGTTNAFVASISRLAYGLARQGVAPAWFDHVDARRATPQRAVLLVGMLAGTGLLLTGILHLSMTQLVYIPNSLGIATYILGTAAGVRLIRHVRGKIYAGIAGALCLAAYPFVGTSIEIPAGVAVCCIGYLLWHRSWEMRRSTSDAKETG